MKTNYLKEMRIARYHIRNNDSYTASQWAYYLKKKLKTLTKKADDGKVFFLPIEIDMDYNNIPNLYRYSYCQELGRSCYPDEAKLSIHSFNPGIPRIKVELDDLYQNPHNLPMFNIARSQLEICFKTMPYTECIITYKDIDLLIYSFNHPSFPNGLVFIFPAIQLSKCPIMLDNILLNVMNITSLLEDMNAELHDREEIIKNSYKRKILKSMKTIIKG